MEKDFKTAEKQPASESNFQMMKFRLHHSLLGGDTPLFSFGISAAC
jgi:hypothetical protein